MQPLFLVLLFLVTDRTDQTGVSSDETVEPKNRSGDGDDVETLLVMSIHVVSRCNLEMLALRILWPELLRCLVDVSVPQDIVGVQVSQSIKENVEAVKLFRSTKFLRRFLNRTWTFPFYELSSICQFVRVLKS